jgi:hypothetical protein
MFTVTVRITFVALVAICLTMISGCCTTAGFLAGAIIDNSNSGQKEIPAWQIGTLQTNDYPTIITKSGYRIQGFYQGLSPLDKSEFSLLYSTFRNTTSAANVFPSLGDTIDIFQSSHKYQKEIFQGFGYKYQKRYSQKGRVRIGSQCYYIMNQSDSITNANRFNLEDIKYVRTAQNDTITGNTLRNLLLNGDIPFPTNAVLATSSQKWLIRLDQIEKISLIRKTKVRALGAGIGLGLDMILFITYMSFSTGPVLGG